MRRENLNAIAKAGKNRKIFGTDERHVNRGGHDSENNERRQKGKLMTTFLILSFIIFEIYEWIKWNKDNHD